MRRDVIGNTHVTRALLAESHRRQFQGETPAIVAEALCKGIENGNRDDYALLCCPPCPGCGCDFCHSVDWTKTGLANNLPT